MSFLVNQTLQPWLRSRKMRRSWKTQPSIPLTVSDFLLRNTDFIVWKGSWFWLFTHLGARTSLHRTLFMQNTEEIPNGWVLFKGVWQGDSQPKWMLKGRLVRGWDPHKVLTKLRWAYGARPHSGRDRPTSRNGQQTLEDWPHETKGQRLIQLLICVWFGFWKLGNTLLKKKWISDHHEKVYFEWCLLANVSATIRGKTRLISAYTFTGVASFLILPQEIASSGLQRKYIVINMLGGL